VEKLYKEREKLLRELEHEEAVFERSKRKGGDDGVRPVHKTGFLGCRGPKVDTIDYLEARSGDLTNQFEEERKRVLETEKAFTAFVIFNNRRSAAQAGQVNTSKPIGNPSMNFWHVLFGVISTKEDPEEETQHSIGFLSAGPTL